MAQSSCAKDALVFHGRTDLLGRRTLSSMSQQHRNGLRSRPAEFVTYLRPFLRRTLRANAAYWIGRQPQNVGRLGLRQRSGDICVHRISRTLLFPAGRSSQKETSSRTFTRRPSVPISFGDGCTRAVARTIRVGFQNNYQDQSNLTSLIANVGPLSLYLKEAPICFVICLGSNY